MNIFNADEYHSFRIGESCYCYIEIALRTGGLNGD